MPFSVKLVGDFYSHALFDRWGKEILDIELAVAEAEKRYKSDWNEVYNGNIGISRIEVLEDSDWVRKLNV